jgi:hypothetical protein
MQATDATPEPYPEKLQAIEGKVEPTGLEIMKKPITCHAGVDH